MNQKYCSGHFSWSSKVQRVQFLLFYCWKRALHFKRSWSTIHVAKSECGINHVLSGGLAQIDRLLFFDW